MLKIASYGHGGINNCVRDVVGYVVVVEEEWEEIISNVTSVIR